MGFIQRTTGDPLDFKKVVISIWFSVPAASIAAAQAKAVTQTNQFGRWNGIIPLMTFGAQTTGQDTGINAVLLGNEPGIGDIFGTELGAATGFDQGPGYIGIRCEPDEDPVIDVYIPIGAPASVSNVRYISDGYVLDDPPTSYTYTNTDVSDTIEDYDDWFGGTSETVIEADTTYHLLISWDLTSGSSCVGVIGGADPEDGVTGSSQMWMALNDVNKTGADLPMLWPGGAFDGNRHVSYHTIQYAGLDNNPFGLPAVTTTVSSVDGDMTAFSAPGSINLVGGADSPVLNIRKGGPLVFLGVSLDTSDEENRRAFILANGRPVSPSEAIALLGKNPEFHIQTGNDWRSGNNRGTAGNLVPTGTIIDYTFDYD